MIFIDKQGTPPFFSRWKLDYPGASYSDMAGAVKQQLMEYMAKEQGYICCYCGGRIRITTENRHSHIEHFNPQKTHRDLALDYYNLGVSCNGESPPDKSAMYCGHAKDDKEISILPTNQRWESLFDYMIDGEIKGLLPEADEIIKCLKLDSVILKRNRKSVIDAVLFSSPSAQALRPISEIRRVAQTCLRMSIESRHMQFCKALHVVINKLTS